jgi:hypothetical protein
MSDTLKEYLIALGFKVDDASYKKWKGAIATGTKEVAGLGAVTVSTATAIALSVEQVAREFEGLAYLSQRTKASVNDLKSYSFGMKQIGIETGTSQAALESFVAAQRLNPGVKGFVGLGGGTGKDPVEQLTNFVEQQKKLYGESGYYVAAMNAELAGIPETVFLQIWNNLPKMRAAQAEANRLRKDAGLAGKEFTDQSVEFANAWDHLLIVLGLGKERIASDLIGPTELGVKALDDIAQGLNRADRATAGWAGTLTGLAIAIGGAGGTLGVLAAFGALLAGKGGAGALAAAKGTLGATAGVGARLLGPLGSAIWLTGVGIEAGKTPEGKNFKASGDFVQDAYGWLRAVKPTLQKRLGVTDESTSGGGGGHAGTVDYFMKQGWPRAVAEGIASNLSSESNFNHQAVGDNGAAFGIAQWHQDRQDAFKAFSGKDIRSSSFEEQLAFIQHELTQGSDAGARKAGQKLRSTNDPYDAGVIFSGLYERPADTYGAAAHKRGQQAANWYDTPLTPGGGAQTAATIHQKTDIHVTAPDPAAAGTAVASAQDRVNGDLVRNFQGAVR